MKTLIVLAMVVALCTGCAQTIKFTKDTAQANLQRVEAEKIIAANLKETYCTWDGPKIRALIGPDITKLPGEIRDQMNELDNLCKTDHLPQWWGLYIRNTISIVLESIRKYLPDAFSQISKYLIL